VGEWELPHSTRYTQQTRRTGQIKYSAEKLDGVTLTCYKFHLFIFFNNMVIKRVHITSGSPIVGSLSHRGHNWWPWHDSDPTN
jgi:hypothetical protein